ncbi:hypothetical protein XENORESO_012352, partial [Xenotaenia resolanae]
VASLSQGNTQTTMHTLIQTPKGNLEKPINLSGTSLDCGRKPEYPERTHACTGENMQTPCRKTPGRESNPGPSCCKATVLLTTLLVELTNKMFGGEIEKRKKAFC